MDRRLLWGADVGQGPVYFFANQHDVVDFHHPLFEKPPQPPRIQDIMPAEGYGLG